MNPNGTMTPEEEIAHLRLELAKKMEKSRGFEDRFTPEDHAHEVVREHRLEPIEAIVPPHSIITEGEKHRLIETLSPRTTDDQVQVLVQVMVDKGIKNALTMAEDLKNPEVEDDFQ